MSNYDGNAADALNLHIDWSSLGKILDEKEFRASIVASMPPLQGNEDYWFSEQGQAFSGVLNERQVNSYSQGFQVGGGLGGDTFQIVLMDGRKPPTK